MILLSSLWCDFMKKAKKVIFLVLITVGVLTTAACAVFCYVIYFPFSPAKNAQQVDILVRWGASFGRVANELSEKGVIRNVDQFKFTAELFDKTQKLRVGKFTLKRGMSHYAALDALVNGPQSYVSVTLPDGYDSRRFAHILEKHLEIDSVKIVNLVADSVFIRELGMETPSLEGFLYPETYQFTFGVGAKQVLRTLVNQFRKMAPDSLFRAAEAMDWSISDVLVLASIIEGEAMVDAEMPIISSVYHNRLKIDMRLQADPTIQYIIPDGPRRLLHRDLRIDSPYNTYLYKGLPPGPINNPGIKAIHAAIFPAETNYLYFVANGDGTHSFSVSYKEHLQAKSKFDEIRKRVETEKRQKELNEQRDQSAANR